MYVHCVFCIICCVLKIEATAGVEVPSMAEESPSNVVDGDEGTGPLPSTSADRSAEGEGGNTIAFTYEIIPVNSANFTITVLASTSTSKGSASSSFSSSASSSRTTPSS